MTGIISQISKLIKDVSNKFFNHDYGQHGFLVISDTNAHVGKFTSIKAEGSAAVVINAAVTTYGDDLSSYTLNAGDVIYGPFTSITLTSGTVVAYYAQKVD
jgi:hypothetical protein